MDSSKGATRFYVRIRVSLASDRNAYPLRVEPSSLQPFPSLLESIANGQPKHTFSNMFESLSAIINASLVGFSPRLCPIPLRYLRISTHLLSFPMWIHCRHSSDSHGSIESRFRGFWQLSTCLMHMQKPRSMFRLACSFSSHTGAVRPSQPQYLTVVRFSSVPTRFPHRSGPALSVALWSVYA